MKRIYLNVYEFIWFCVSKHCAKLFALNTKIDNPLTHQESYDSANGWLEEIGLDVQDNLAAVKDKYCLPSLLKAYITSIQLRSSVYRELKLRKAHKSYSAKATYIRSGKFLLASLLVISIFIGLFFTYSYQSMNNQFTFTALLVAVISYFGIAWYIFQARALPHFKLTLLCLIALTSFSGFFWKKWEAYISKAGECYSELCILIMPETIFQDMGIRLALITFWLIFLVLVSIKNPITDYLNFKMSNNRSL